MASQKESIAKGLSKLLADSYILSLKTHNYHWNVTGPLFHTLHKIFEEQYTDLLKAADTIAERIRALGVFAPGSYSNFKSLTSIKEAEDVPSAENMIKNLISDHEIIVQTAQSVFPLAEEGKDEVTLDLLTQRMEWHEKTIWMLKSSL